MYDITKNLTPIKAENALYVVATPIGNLFDITIRALQTLIAVDEIICEDTRVSNILLDKFKITNKKLIVYNDFSDAECREKILNKLLTGNSLALVSDAGTPIISDIGYKLVNFLRQQQQKIIPIPGPSALTAAICVSGIAADNFLFLGFLPTVDKQKIETLKFVPSYYSFVFYESANRIVKTLKTLQDLFSQRRLCIARELTKIHEEVVSGSVDEVMDFFTHNAEKIRGEFVVIVEKQQKKQQNFTHESLIAEIKKLLNENKSVKDIALELAGVFDIHKKELYKIILSQIK